MDEQIRFPKVDKYGDRFALIPKSARWKQNFQDDLHRLLLEGSIRIVETKHAQLRMKERRIIRDDILFVLEFGKLIEVRLYEKKSERERYVFRGRDFDDSRTIEVVVVIENEVIIVTVWSEK